MRDLSSSDADLLQALGQDDRESAWEEFIERFRSLVYAVCFRILRERQLAEDAAQAVWAQIVKKKHTYERPRPVGAWVARIARNVAIDLRRQGATRQKHTGGDFTHAELSSPAPDERADPDLARQLDRLDREIRGLPVEHQAVLFLVSNENRTHPGLGRATQRATAEALDYRNDDGEADHNRVNRLLIAAHRTLLERLSQTEDMS